MSWGGLKGPFAMLQNFRPQFTLSNSLRATKPDGQTDGQKGSISMSPSGGDGGHLSLPDSHITKNL